MILDSIDVFMLSYCHLPKIKMLCVNDSLRVALLFIFLHPFV